MMGGTQEGGKAMCQAIYIGPIISRETSPGGVLAVQRPLRGESAAIPAAIPGSLKGCGTAFASSQAASQEALPCPGGISGILPALPGVNSGCASILLGSTRLQQARCDPPVARAV